MSEPTKKSAGEAEVDPSTPPAPARNSEHARALETLEQSAADRSRRRASLGRMRVDDILGGYVDERRQQGGVDEEDTAVRRLSESIETRRALAQRLGITPPREEETTVADADELGDTEPSTLPSARNVLLVSAGEGDDDSSPFGPSGPETLPPGQLGGLEGRAWDYLHDRDVTVLVADDDEDMRLLIQRELERLGYQVRLASNGLDAQNRAFEPPWPDLIVLDVRMPKIGGIGVARALADSDMAHVPILLISGLAAGVPRQDGWLYLQKDGTLHDKMRAIIEEKVGRGRQT